MSADTTRPTWPHSDRPVGTTMPNELTVVSRIAGALSRAATSNGARLRDLRYPLARAALDAAYRPITLQNAASLRVLGHEAAAVALERAADDEEAGDGDR